MKIKCVKRFSSRKTTLGDEQYLSMTSRSKITYRCAAYISIIKSQLASTQNFEDFLTTLLLQMNRTTSHDRGRRQRNNRTIKGLKRDTKGNALLSRLWCWPPCLLRGVHHWTTMAVMATLSLHTHTSLHRTSPTPNSLYAPGFFFAAENFTECGRHLT